MPSEYLQEMNKNNRAKGKMQSQEHSASQKKGIKPRGREIRQFYVFKMTAITILKRDNRGAVRLERLLDKTSDVNRH